MYGGTKEEMERLLADAEKLSGQKFDLSSYADIVEAIHVIQEEMGITGTTAKEASETISGSIASMKSAWGNFLVGLSAGDQDMNDLTQKLAESISTVGKNLIPRVITTAKTIGTVLADNVKAHGGEAIEKLGEAFTEGIPKIIQKGTEIISNLAQSFRDNYPQILQTGLELILKLAKGIMDSMPLLLEKAPQIIGDIAGGLVKSLPVILSAGADLIATLGKGILKAAPSLLKAIGGIGDEILELLTLPFKKAWETISGIIDGIKNAISSITDKVASISGGEGTKKQTSTVKSPKLSAHAKGGILTKPTIFGYTPSTSTYHLGGEAGAEAVAPISTLKTYIKEAIQEVQQPQQNNNQSYNFTFNSPKAITPAEANRQAKRAYRDLQLGF